METLLASCSGGFKWHWYSIMEDLHRAGLKSVVIQPFPLGPNCFPGSYKGKNFIVSWAKDTLLMVSMKEKEYPGATLRELVDGFSKVVEYRPFCKYRFNGLATVEWDKHDPHGRRRQLEDEGKAPEKI